MAGLPWPGSSEHDARNWDNCVLGGHVLPGRVEVDVESELEVDDGKPTEKHGSNLKIKGYKPRKVTITWSLWHHADVQAEWDEMQDALNEWEPITNKAPTQPFDLFHPKAAVRNVYSVVIKKIKGPDYDKGLMTVRLDCIEWNKPAKAAAKGSGTAKNSGAGWTSGGTASSFGASEWQQTPDANGNITTTATKTNPSKTETKP